jgi:hypothetical protein
MPLSQAQQSGACNGAGHLRDGVDTDLSNVHQSNGTHSFLCCSPNTSPIANWVHVSTRLLTHAPPPVPSHCNQILAYQKVNSQLIKCPHHHDYKTKSSQTGTFRCSMKYISIHLMRMSCSVSEVVNGQLKILSATDGVYQKLHYNICCSLCYRKLKATMCQMYNSHLQSQSNNIWVSDLQQNIFLQCLATNKSWVKVRSAKGSNVKPSGYMTHLFSCNVWKVFELENVNITMESLIQTKDPPAMWKM